MLNVSRKYRAASLFLRSAAFLYLATFFVFEVLLLPTTQDDIEYFIKDVRDMPLTYSFLVFFHYLIRYDVMPSDKICAWLPANVKRKILVLFALSFLWMMLAVSASQCFQQLLTSVPRIVLWFAHAAHVFPFLFPFLITGRDRVDLKRCAPWVIGIECILAAIMLFCAVYICGHYIRIIRGAG